MPKQNGRPTDSPEVRASKTLAYILRHGAEKEGLMIRSDGLVKLKDVVSANASTGRSHLADGETKS